MIPCAGDCGFVGSGSFRPLRHDPLLQYDKATIRTSQKPLHSDTPGKRGMERGPPVFAFVQKALKAI